MSSGVARFGVNWRNGRERKGFISLSISNTVGVNISLAFPQWSKLKGEKGLKRDLEITAFLLDR